MPMNAITKTDVSNEEEYMTSKQWLLLRSE